MAQRIDDQAVRVGIIILLLFGAVVGIFVVSPPIVVRQLSALQDEWLILAVLAGIYLLWPFVLAPMSLITVFVGFRYGVLLGYPIALLGTAVTTLPPYVLGTCLRTTTGLIGWLSNYGYRAVHVTGEFRGIVAARLSPAPADAVSYGAGLSNISLSTYVTGTVVGELPWAAAYLLLGASLRQLKGHQVAIDWWSLAGMTITAGLLLARPVYRWVTDVRTEEPSSG